MIVTLLLLAAATAVNATTLHETVDKTLEVGPSAVLSLGNTNGTVTITGWDQPRIRVVAEKTVERAGADEAKSALAQLKVDIQQHGNTVSIRTESPERHSGSFWDLILGNWNAASVRYEVSVPRSMKVDVDDTNGAIEVSGVNGTFKLETTNGHIQLTRCGGAVDLETTNGRIEADLLTLDAQANNRIETTNGRIEITVPATLRAEVDAATTNGSVNSELPITTRTFGRNELRGSVNGGGGAPLKLRTTNGSIHIGASQAGGSSL